MDAKHHVYLLTYCVNTGSHFQCCIHCEGQSHGTLPVNHTFRREREREREREKKSRTEAENQTRRRPLTPYRWAKPAPGLGCLDGLVAG